MSRESDPPDFGWHYRGGERPPFARSPGPGQESIWDYPRPPALRPDTRRVEVYLGAHLVARSTAAYRMLETAGAPTFYLPPGDTDQRLLRPTTGTSWCEWKGRAAYWDVHNGDQVAARGAWSYPDADSHYAAIAGYLAFYVGQLDCFVAGERVRAQPGGFYGGWVTDDVVGPFKGEPGTQAW